jgi:hypothetical protein
MISAIWGEHAHAKPGGTRTNVHVQETISCWHSMLISYQSKGWGVTTWLNKIARLGIKNNVKLGHKLTEQLHHDHIILQSPRITKAQSMKLSKISILALC